MSQSKKLKKLVFNYYHVFMITFFIGSVINLSVMCNELHNPDSIWKGDYSVSGSWELSLGRWALPFMDILSGGIHSVVLSSLLTLGLLSFSTVLLVDFFQVKRRSVQVLASILFILNPAITFLLTYPYCSYAYAFAMVLSIVSVRCVISIRGIKGILAGGIGFMLSLGIYQAFLGSTAMVMLVYLIKCILRKIEWDEILKIIVRMAGFFLLGVGLYYGMMKTVLYVMNVKLASYKGASDVGVLNIIRSLPSGVKQCYVDFYKYYFTDQICRNSFGIKYINGLLWGVLLLVIFCLGKALCIKEKMLLALIMASLPVACNFIDLMAPSTTVILLTSEGMMGLLPCLLMGIFGCQWYNSKNSRHFEYALIVLLCWGFTLQDSSDLLLMNRIKTQTIALANRISYTIERINSQKYTKILISGTPGDVLSQQGELVKRTDHFAKYGLVWSSLDGMIYCWKNVLYTYIGRDYEFCTVSEYERILATEEYNNMPRYPQDGSVYVLGDVLVVKLADFS